MEWMIYYLFINLVSILVMRMDKLKAKKSQRRISERTLFICAWIGGSVGIFIGMRLFRHKTKHVKFTIGIPLIILIQIGLIAIIMMKQA